MPDGIENLVDRDGGVLRRQTAQAGGKGGDQIRARHGTDLTSYDALGMS
jgi:hypothetical protein